MEELNHFNSVKDKKKDKSRSLKCIHFDSFIFLKKKRIFKASFTFELSRKSFCILYKELFSQLNSKKIVNC